VSLDSQLALCRTITAAETLCKLMRRLRPQLPFKVVIASPTRYTVCVDGHCEPEECIVLHLLAAGAIEMYEQMNGDHIIPNQLCS
jgi:hypothetical protein